MMIYALPIILSTIIQDLFNTIDLAVLARMGSLVAHASVGATSTITTLIVNSFFGLSTGVKIMLSRYYGAKDEESARKTVSTALISSFFLGVVIAIVGFIFAPTFLEFVNCPDECIYGATLYIRLYVAAAPAILIYNFGAAIIRSLGDSQRPLYYILICGVVNIVLNVILCIVLPQKVLAVAIATVVSQILGAVFAVTRITKLDGVGKIDLKKLSFSMPMFTKIIRYGFPVALSSALFPLANLQIQSALNSYGAAAISGSTASQSLDKFPLAVGSGFCATTIAFAGQNVGAGKPDRVKKTFIHSMWISTLLATASSLFLYFTSDVWLAILQPNDPMATEYAKIRMMYLLLFYGLMGPINVWSGALQAFGYTMLNTITSLTTVLGFRTVWMTWVYPLHPTFHVLMQCFTVSLFLRAAAYFVFYIVVYRRYKKGKYAKL
jgi:putative MATE family efflux protein